jgi:hypothetical protein
MRYISLLLIFTTLFIEKSFTQKISKEYFIGKWKSVDSSNWSKEVLHFKRNKLLTFHRFDNRAWNYIVRDRDSVTLLYFDLHLKNMDFNDEAVLIIQNAACFWWFNPHDYDMYLQALQNGYSAVHKDKFDEWIKERRSVFYKLNSN